MPELRSVYFQSCSIVDNLPMLIYCADNCEFCPAAVAAQLPEGRCTFSFKLKRHKYKEATEADVMLSDLKFEKQGYFMNSFHNVFS